MSDTRVPGVFVEETGLRSPEIVPLPTSTAAFLGETEKGPQEPSLVTSFAEYQNLFGDAFLPGQYLPHAVKAFFDNGGRRAYIARVAGADGAAPGAADYRGEGDGTGERSGLAALEADPFEEVSIVCAPGATAEVAREVIAHCERSRFRFAVIDAPAGSTPDEALEARDALGDSLHAAFYFPWVVVRDPQTGSPLAIPPSGAVCGIYAQVDSTLGVWRAPANEAVLGAIDLEREISNDEQERLNPRGVNGIRRLPGRDIRVWGARTLAGDPDWKYISVRRLVLFLEKSIVHSTRWAAFEPNDARLWVQIKHAISSFLTGQWLAGALAGARAEDAFTVSVGPQTMTEEDMASGRLIVEIGIAAVRPAELLVLRIEYRVEPWAR